MNLGAKILRDMIEGYKKILNKNIDILAKKQKIAVEHIEEIAQKGKQMVQITPEIGTDLTQAQIPIRILPILAETKEKEHEEKSATEKQIEEGIELPTVVLFSQVKPGRLEKEIAPLMQMAYPLIPKKPTRNEPVLAYAKIYWDKTEKRYFYEIVEPKMTKRLKEILNKVKDLLEQRLDVEFSKMKSVEMSGYLQNQIKDIINYFGFKLSDTEKLVLKYYIERDFIGLGRIEPMMRDEQIEDISCDGIGIPIFVFHRNPNLGSVITNIKFDDSDELDSFIIRLTQISGKSISVTEPLIDATLPDGSRLQATLATDIARKGSNFTIRKFTEEPLTPTHLMNYKTIDSKSLAFLWMAIEYGRSILVSGGTASGKTSLLNVLSLFIRPEKKIISIEDTAELQLPHSHWVPSVARTPIATDVARAGQIDMFELLRESFRQRPDYIIVGEVRGKEAYVLFQQMATGHTSLATIHSENIQKLIDRLTTPPISLSASLITNADIIVFIARMRYKDRHVRRVTEVLEIVGYDREKNIPIVNKIFNWNSMTDTLDLIGKSIILKKISLMTGINEKDLVEELKRRITLLEWMREKGIMSYTDVFKVFSEYYSSPMKLMSYILGES